MNPMESLSRAKKTQEAALQKFGKGLMIKYKAAKMDWENSPRYKKALERAKYEGNMNIATTTPPRKKKKILKGVKTK